jgi:GT2 family glycosyltransferase
MLNNDTFVQPDFLTPLISYLNKYPKAGAIQPKIFFHHNRNLVWNAGGYFNRLVGFTYTTGHNKPFHSKYDLLKQVDWITGCAFLVRNDVLRQTGLLANNMFMYSEDVDLSMRIRNQDYILVYEPASVIYHIAGIAGKSKTKGKEGYTNPMVHYLNQRNRIWILKKYIPWYFLPTTVLFNFFYILLVMGYFAMRGRFHKLKTVARAVKSGLSESIKYH